MSLKSQAVSGMLWTFTQQFSNQIIGFIVSIILARILLPSDFGTIALFSVVMGIGSYLVDGGMASSLIRTRDIEEKDLSTVFCFNVAVGLGLYIIIFFTAPLIAAFFEVDILTSVIRVYCIILIINSFVIVQKTRFTKELDFKTAFKIQLPSLIIGGIAGVSFAYMGFGIWSLVYFPIIQSLVSTIQYWFYSDWRPKILFDKAKFKYHFSFGYRMTLSGLLDILYINVYTVVIGKLFSPAQLGFYNRADSLKQLPVSNISSALNKVTYPLFAKISNDDEKLREVYQKIMKLVIFIVAPLLCLMIVVAEPLFRFLLTDKWLPAVPYFQILAVAGILYPIHAYNLNVLQVKGRADLFLRLEIIKKIIIVIVLVISIQFGMMGIVWGQVVLSVIALFINTYYTGKILKYTAWQQFLDLVPSLIIAGGAAIVLYFLDQMFLSHAADLIRLIVISLIYAIVYLGIVYLMKFKELSYIKEIIKK